MSAVWARPGLTWAPCCACIPQPGFKSQYVLFFVARENATDKQAIGVAVSDRPEGPFDSKDERPLISTVRMLAYQLCVMNACWPLCLIWMVMLQPAEGGSIDPSCCLDRTGRCILFWKNDGNAVGQPCWIRACSMSPDGLRVCSLLAWHPQLSPDFEEDYTQIDGPSQNLFCNDGGSWEGHVIEAPFPYRRGDTYYLLYVCPNLPAVRLAALLR